MDFGCFDDEILVKVTKGFSVNKQVVDFGDVEVGSSRELVLTVNSSLQGQVMFTMIPPIDPFFADPVEIQDFVLAGGGSMDITLTFTPTSTGSRNSFVTFRTNADSETEKQVTVELVGSGVERSEVDFVTLMVVATDGVVNISTSDTQIQSCVDECSIQFVTGTRITLTATTSQECIEFLGWADQNCDESESVCELTLDRDKQVQAEFDESEFVLTMQATGEGGGLLLPNGFVCDSTQDQCSFDVACGEIVTVTATTTDHCLNATDPFWGGVCSGETGMTCTTTMSESRNITARFERHEYDLHLTTIGSGGLMPNPRGDNCGSGCFRYDCDTVVDISSLADICQDRSWSGDCVQTSSSSDCQLVMSSDHAVGIELTHRSVDLTVNVFGTGNETVTDQNSGFSCVSGQSCTQTFQCGDSVTLTPIESPCGVFDSWSVGTCTSTAPCSLVLNQDENVTATFVSGQGITGRIHVMGGSRYSSTLDEVVVSDISCDGILGPWRSTTPLPLALLSASAVRMGEYIIVLGGNQLFSTPRRNVWIGQIDALGNVSSWVSGPTLPNGVERSRAVTWNGHVCLTGGLTGSGATSDILCARFDTTQGIFVGSWSLVASLSTARFFHGAVTFGDNLYILGGTTSSWGSSSILDDVQMSTFSISGSSLPQLTAWVQQPNMNPGRLGHSTVVNGRTIYTSGGYGQGVGFINSVQSANISSGGTVSSWVNTSTLSQPRSYHSMLAHNGYLYVIGGDDTPQGSPNETADVQYSQANASGRIGRWLSTTSLPRPRVFHFAVVGP